MMPEFELQKGDILFSTKKELLDLKIIHDFLTNSYWSPGISKETVERAIVNALTVGLYYKGEQVGFCRVISDYTTFGYLADVFVVEKHRGNGLGVWMLETIKKIPELTDLRRWVLATKDAHGMYEKLGWKRLAYSEYFMEIVKEGGYGE